MATITNPTRMELTRLKRKNKTATRGHKLLKDKRDEMVRRFIDLVRRQKELREQCEAALAACMARFSRARAEMGDAAAAEALSYPVRRAAVKTSRRNIMGIEVPVIEFIDEGDSFDLPYSFAFSSSELDGAVLDLAALLPKLIELAEIEKSCNMLADEIEKTRRRVNALEHIVIPETEQQIKYITMKLSENERSNLTRLMKVKDMLAAQDGI